MRTQLISVAILVTTLSLSSLLAQASTDYDFFYLVLQWPGSYCDTRRKCCYPTTGKPATDFGIHGLWPNYYDGSWPSNCNPDNPFDASQIYDLRKSLEKQWPTLACPSGTGLKFWAHEWNKHGTCAEALFDQHQYFETNLNLKKQANLLNVLRDAGIYPDDSFYTFRQISDAIRAGLNVTSGIVCNMDRSGNSQLYEVYFCVDNMATGFINCPLLPKSRCRTKKIQFPLF